LKHYEPITLTKHTHTLTIRYRPHHVTDKPTNNKKTAAAITASGGSLQAARRIICKPRKLGTTSCTA